MPTPIKVLSTVLANQIAAGEVIERPASVLKELLENALDAGAKNISVFLEDAGTTYICVRDDGHGIPASDLLLAFQRHATSKVTSFDDLLALKTLGFRGEALASMASVSSATLQSAVAGEMGYQLRVQGDAEGEIEPVAHPVGTTVKIEDLFYNVPVRRKFLKGWRTEYMHCMDVFRKMALSHPEVGFRLNHQQKETLHWPPVLPGQWEERIRQVLGHSFVHAMHPFQEQATDRRLWGWIVADYRGDPMAQRQYTFVNGRAVRDRVLQYAIRMGCGEQRCSMVLFLEIDPRHLDVNVHPTKHELRFHEPSVIHHMIVSALQGVMGSLPAAPALANTEIYGDNPFAGGDGGVQVTASYLQWGAYGLWAEPQQPLRIVHLRSVAQILVRTIHGGKKDPFFGGWEPWDLPFPVILSLHEKENDFLESPEGGLLLEQLALQGRRIHAKQWALEACPFILRNSDWNILIPLMLLNKEWMVTIGVEIWKDMDHDSRDMSIQTLIASLDEQEKKHCLAVFEESELEQFFV
jgi:DNA mismatch repair protein MutL